MNWYLKVLRQYADFNGRARRTEFWMFVLFNALISWILSLIDGLIGLDFAVSSYAIGVGVLSSLYGLFVLIPSIAVAVRRLHDTGRSGWWYLLIFVPIVGAIVLLVFFVLDSQPGTNEYGPNPKGIEESV